MCGRFTQRFSWREAHEYLNAAGPALNARPRYNGAPGQDVAAVGIAGQSRPRRQAAARRTEERTR